MGGHQQECTHAVFHPMVLYMMQAQTPFLALKFVHNYILQDQRSLEANTFLWNGSSSDLPTLRLNLRMTKVLCTSTQAVFEKVLNEINTLVSTYSNDTVVKYDYYVYLIKEADLSAVIYNYIAYR